MVSEVEQLFARQLELMRDQLSVLGSRDTRPRGEEAVPRPVTDMASVPPSSHRSPRATNTVPNPYLADFAKRYNGAHARSKSYADEHRAYLADSRRAVGFRSAIRSMLYPIAGDRAKGAHIRDIDGNDYVDLTMGFGVLLTGHAPDFLEAPLARHRSNGLDLGPQSAMAGEVARLTVEFTGLPRVTFCNSGTEAAMTAMRLARAATRRNRIVVFAGSYHGHFDGVLALGGTGGSIPLSTGTPQGFVGDIMVVDYGSEAALAAIRAHADELAAVLVEPVQSRAPENQPRAFLHELREICDASGTALIFDELLTGFRIAPGGAQEWFGVRADMATYGKIMGGGSPIGVIAGQPRFLDGIDGGNWGDEDGNAPSDRIFVAGTFNKNGSTMAAARAMLLHLKAQGPHLQARLNDATSDLAARLNAVFQKREVAIRVVWFGSMFRFVIAGEADVFFYHLIQNGLYVWEGRTCFLSTAHRSSDIDRVVEAVAQSVDEMLSGGLLRPAASSHL